MKNNEQENRWLDMDKAYNNKTTIKVNFIALFVPVVSE